MKNKISTRSLYHYTKTFENLLGILDNGLKYNYIKEDLPFTMPKNSFFSKFNATDMFTFVQPIACVCFCDLPFDRVENHKEQYGQYCIGMSKEWAMENSITPVRYIHKYSPDIRDERYKKLTQYSKIYEEHNKNMIHLIANYLKQKDSDFNYSLYQKWYDECPDEAKKIFKCFNSEYFDVIDYLSFSMGFLRAYRGEWQDRVSNKKIEKVFYDEREWRALKPLDEKKDYLTFDFKNIDHIVILTENEKDTLIEKYEKTRHTNIKQKVHLHKEVDSNKM